MRITPTSLIITRFKSFKERTVFTFPDTPGLYFIQGINEAEPRLDRNGTGKTTLWDALTWCLHGKTARGLKAGDVCNWDSEKGVDVRFEFAIDDGTPNFLIRTWGPNSWTYQNLFDGPVDLTKDEANPVLAAVRLHFEPWLNTILMAQTREMFLDLDKGKQAQLFSDVLGLEAWAERSERASKRASAQDAVNRTTERDLAEARGRLEALEDADAGVASDRWERERLEALDALDASFEEGCEQRRDLVVKLEDAEEQERKARLILKELSTDSGLTGLLQHERAELRRVEDECRDAANNLRGLDEREADLMDEKAPCPLCGHLLDERTRREHLAKVDTQIRAVTALIGQMNVTVERRKAEVDRLERSIEAERQFLEMSRTAVRRAESDTSNARRDIQLLDKRLDVIEDRIDEHTDAVNPFAQGLEKQRAERERMQDVVDELQRKLDDGYMLHSIASGWVRWFKEIRLRAIAEALEELEIEVNSAVSALGLVGWELLFAVDKEGKGGGVQRGFSVLVKSPASGSRPVPWESWSGGEGQRLRIATQMGLADLIRARTGCDMPLEVWDEPTSGLSPQGLTDLFEALRERALHEGRTIFLVDHKAHSFGGFAGTATVIKTRSGSRIRTSWGKDV